MPHATLIVLWQPDGLTMLLAIVDSGPLLASANAADPDHAVCVEALTEPGVDLVIPALCVAQVAWFLGHRHGPRAESLFVEGLSRFTVLAPEAEDWPRIARLVRRYADLPLGTTDASVAVLADRLATRRIITLDRRHFSVLRDARGQGFELRP